MTAAIADLEIERLVRIDQSIDENESTALRSRWEFGQQMLAARDGKKKLPDGTRRLARTPNAHTGIGRREPGVAAAQRGFVAGVEAGDCMTVILLVAVVWLVAAALVVVFMAGATRGNAGFDVVAEAERIVAEAGR